jgi:polygalacturonase
LARFKLTILSIGSAALIAACALPGTQPRATGVSALEHLTPALPVIPDRVFSLADYGAVGDGRTLNTEAFKRAIAAVDRAGGGKLVVPAGIYRTLPFALCSNLDFHLDAGAVIQAPDSFAAYGLPDPQTLASQADVAARVKTPEPLITGRNLHDVALTGPGTVDGNGALWWAWSERAAHGHPGRLVYGRPNLVAISGCQRLRVAELTFMNSPKFHLVPSNITDLTIERVTVQVTARDMVDAPNTDAIDPGPVTNALIRDCTTDTGDDDICIKSGGTNVLIENCRILRGHGISIGSGTTVGVHRMLVRHCTFEGTDNGIRIKSMRGAGGPVADVRYTDLRMKDVANVIVLDLAYTDSNRPDFKGDPAKVPSIHDILIDHLDAQNCKNTGKIVGLPDSRITGITLRNVDIGAQKALVIKDADRPTLDQAVLRIAP